MWGTVRPHSWAPCDMVASSSGDVGGHASEPKVEGVCVAMASRDDASVEGAAAPKMATEASHRDIVFLDQVGEQAFILTNVVTGESKALPPGQVWDLEFDEDSGAGVVFSVSDDNERPMMVSELLKKTVFADDEGGYHVLMENQLGGKPVAWARALTAHLAAVATITLGPTQASLEMSVWVFRVDRPGKQKAFWDICAFYKGLGMDSYKGFPSKWFWNLHPVWSAFLKQHFAPDQFVLSTHTGLSSDKADVVPWHLRCLPASSVSTAGMLILLTRWAFCTKRCGGLGSQSQKEGAAQYLASFIREVVPVGGGGS